MTTVAALLVTKDSRQWIEQTLGSVMGQTRPPEEIVVVDDHSTDDTVDVVRGMLGDAARLLVSTAVGNDPATRIAHNFQQGVQACRDAEVVVLGDHDDIWQPDRIAHQVEVLQSQAQVDLVASDGLLVDEQGRRLGGTLREVFPVPSGYNELPAGERLRVAIRHSVATGGASAVRPASYADVLIPPGWLHDRWWSLVAAARETLWIDERPVIDYRLSAGQEVGLAKGHQDGTPMTRLWNGAVGFGETLTRLGDLRSLAGVATARTRPELAAGRLLRTLL
jgi:glycosyltransferase involved in cell wall biosynthesis